MKRGFTGAKPEPFCRWVMDMLGWKPGDKIVDVFVGSGAFSRTVLAASQEFDFEQLGIA
jgi:ubiquinone/menaquinone biosynthesis C-methylase UbiE